MIELPGTLYRARDSVPKKKAVSCFFSSGAQARSSIVSPLLVGAADGLLGQRNANSRTSTRADWHFSKQIAEQWNFPFSSPRAEPS